MSEGDTAVAEKADKARRAPVMKVGVVGAGTMGSGIAQKAAMEGAEVVLVDQGEQYLEKGRKAIEELLKEGRQRRVLRPEAAAAALKRLNFTLDFAALKDADLVIEAVFENPKVKGELFAKLDGICGAETIFATNTSSLSVAELAHATQRPDRFVGMHYFFHPVKNRLVEIVPIKDTRPDVLERVVSFSRATGKIPIEVNDTPGFAVNRFFVPWLNEAVRLLEEGAADIATIDAAAMRAFGVPMGPFKLMNVTGVPIALHAADGLGRRLSAFYSGAEALRKQVESKKEWDLSGSPDEAAAGAVARRLWGVVYWVAAALAEEGGAAREDIDRGAKIALRWPHGPFESMNARGLKESAAWVREVCETHSLEIPKSLAAAAGSGKKWELNFVNLIKDGSTARIILNRPETMNALSEDLVPQIAAAVAAAQADSAVRVILLEGRGKAFVAGADVKFFADSIKKGDLDAVVSFTEEGQRLLRRIETSEKPVIAVLDGAALGGGAELALACRFRVAGPKALLRFPETALGIYPGLGATQRLPRLIGKQLAKHFILTGAPIPAPMALALGLIDALCPPEETAAAVARLLERKDVERRPDAQFNGLKKLYAGGGAEAMISGKAPEGGDPAAAKALKAMSKRAPLALKIANELIDQGLERELEDGLKLELSRLKEIFSTADAAEGLAALLAGRAPAFKGE